ncbi:MAG: threonine aldolase [Flavobacteriaceae bacterium]|jgi:threonine aldolase|nr:threonine aldolase [Flavobacteriaceae bacterium]
MKFIHSFANDYSEGCHPSILEALTQSNLEQHPGYGDDSYTQTAVALLRKMVDDPYADIYLIAGGTLTNLLVLSAILKPFESVIAADTSHINTRETGAIEATGHKIETVPTPDGKLSPELILPILNKPISYHTVRPKAVYISNSTELGTIYTKKELTLLSEFCKENELFLFIDGARLAYALTSQSNDLTLKDIAELTDIFYVGGAKCGALLGEAVVITREEIKKDFKYHIKQRGAMLAKGRILGIQFTQLLQDGLIFQLAAHANSLANKMTLAIKSLGYPFLTESYTNQIFPILPNEVIDKLKINYGFFIWEAVDRNHSAIRLITSWATPEEKIDCFINDLKFFKV